MTDRKDLLKAAKEIQELCAYYANDCWKTDEGSDTNHDYCPFYNSKCGCILKEYPEKWRLS